MKRCISLCLAVFLTVLTGCSVTIVDPVEDIVITDDAVYTLQNAKIASISEKGEPLPFLYVQGEEKAFYYEEDLIEEIRQYYRLQESVDIEYQSAAVKDTPVFMILSVKRFETVEIDIPEVTGYDISWKDGAVLYTGDFSYLQDLDENVYTRRSACKVFREEFPEGAAGAWCTCEVLKDELYYYPFDDAFNHLDDQVFLKIEGEYIPLPEEAEYVNVKDSLFYFCLKNASEILPVPDIYGGLGNRKERLLADIDGGSVSLNVYEGKEGGIFLSVSLVLKNPDYDPGKGPSDPYYYYRSVVYFPEGS